MQYMIVWGIKPEHFGAVVRRFTEADPKPEPGAKMLGRWHEMGSGKGFTLMEATDAAALSKYLIAWSDLVDLKIVPVVGDEEIAKALA